MEQEQLYRQVFSSIAEASSRAMRAVDELRESLDDKTMSEMLNSHVIILYISALDKLLSFAMMFMFITGAITKKELRPSKKTQPGVINTYVGLGEKFKLLHGLGVFNRYYTRVNFDAYAHTRNVHLHGVQLVIAYFVNWSDDKFPKAERISLYGPFARAFRPEGMFGAKTSFLIEELTRFSEHLGDYFANDTELDAKLQRIQRKLRELDDQLLPADVKRIADSIRSATGASRVTWNDVALHLNDEHLGVCWSKLLK